MILQVNEGDSDDFKKKEKQQKKSAELVSLSMQKQAAAGKQKKLFRINQLFEE